MNRTQQIEKNDQIRAYFRREFAGKISDVNQARKQMQARFHLTTSKWYQMRPQFVRIMNEPQEGKEETVEGLSSPPEGAGTPIEQAQLVTIAQQQDARIAQQALQIDYLKAQSQAQEETKQTLLKIVDLCLESM